MEYLLATKNPQLSRVFRKPITEKGAKLNIIDTADKLNKIIRKKGKILEVIILDLTMPGKDLNQYIFYIKQFKQDIPVILFSFKRSLSKESEAMRNLSVYGCIRKPSSSRELQEMLDDLDTIFELDMDKKLEKVEYLGKEKVFACTFRNKQDLFLPRKDIPEDDGSAIKEVDIDKNRYHFSVLLKSGKQYEVPWDFVRYICDEKYEFSRQKSASAISPKEIGQRITWLRKSRKITQGELAAKTGIQRANIARIESGRHSPSLETLERIADSLQTPVARLIVS
jgi:DNA-binding XRE family transcriptional regulator